MSSRILLSTAGIAIIVLAIVMAYLGLLHGGKVVYPPTVTGIGFLVIGGVFLALPGARND